MDFGLLLGVVLILIAIVHAYQMHRSRKSLAPWVPSSKKTLQKALTHINPKPGARFIDLGSGSGSVAIAASKSHKLKTTGVEKAFIPYLLAMAKKITLSKKDVTFRRGDLYDVNLSSYDVIYVFGLPETVNGRLLSKFSNELNPGSVVISNYFPIHTKKADHIIADRWRRVYIYRW